MDIARVIDHTLLKPEATGNQIFALCTEALQYGFASVCVNSCFVPLTRHLLCGARVNTCSVVGFPLGACTTRTKVFEAARAIEYGAQEIDMVINIGRIKDGSEYLLASEIRDVRGVVPYPHILKFIIESAVLTDSEIRWISALCADEGADFVKTSTGMHPTGGATVEHVKLIKATVGDKALVKASGGIKTYADVLKFLEAGASRIGTSSGVAIVREASLQNQGAK